MPLQHPLTDEHCKCLDRVLESYTPAMDLAKACQDCGWDVSNEIDTLNAQRRMAETAKARFFPQRV